MTVMRPSNEEVSMRTGQALSPTYQNFLIQQAMGSSNAYASPESGSNLQSPTSAAQPSATVSPDAGNSSAKPMVRRKRKLSSEDDDDEEEEELDSDGRPIKRRLTT